MEHRLWRIGFSSVFYKQIIVKPEGEGKYRLWIDGVRDRYRSRSVLTGESVAGGWWGGDLDPSLDILAIIFETLLLSHRGDAVPEPDRG